MIKFVLAVGLMALAVSGCNSSSGGGASVASSPQSPPTSAQPDNDIVQFAFQNDTTWGAVTELYVAAESQQGWGPELLSTQGGAIPEGTTRSISINDGREDCVYEVYYRQPDGGDALQSSVDMCADNVVVLGSNACSPDFCGTGRGNP